MAENKQQLKSTSEIEVVRKWTEDDKRRWWKSREETDKAIEEVLCSLQQMLGPWSSLLCDRTDSKRSQVQQDKAFKLEMSEAKRWGVITLL